MSNNLERHKNLSYQLAYGKGVSTEPNETQTTLPLEVTSHKAFEPWMVHWVFMTDGILYGYAADHDLLTKEEDIDTFFKNYKEECAKWVNSFGGV